MTRQSASSCSECVTLIAWSGYLFDICRADDISKTFCTEVKYVISVMHRTADGELEMLTVINVYCPRAEPDNEDRLMYKLNFYRLLQLRAETLLQHR